MPYVSGSPDPAERTSWRLESLPAALAHCHTVPVCRDEGNQGPVLWGCAAGVSSPISCRGSDGTSLRSPMSSPSEEDAEVGPLG